MRDAMSCWGLWVRVWGLGFGVCGLGFGGWGVEMDGVCDDAKGIIIIMIIIFTHSPHANAQPFPSNLPAITKLQIKILHAFIIIYYN